MKPASQFPAAAARGLAGVLLYPDHTVLDRGPLRVGALPALYRLAEAGLILVGVTGRPAGWGQVLARQWPVSGMVTENGIIALVQRGHRGELLDRARAAQRPARRAQLGELVRELRSRFAELEPSDDVAGRV